MLGLLAISAALASCGKKADLAPQALDWKDDQPPSLEQLSELLDAEFKRLGVDPARAVAKAPAGADSQVYDLRITNIDPDGPGLGSELPSAIKMDWTERFNGDLNQDGVVSVQDLAPIGQNFRQTIEYDDPNLHGGLTHWPHGDAWAGGTRNWRLARVDGISDGVISVNDLTAIGLHFGERMDGYVIRRGVNRGGGSIEWDSETLDLGAGNLPGVRREEFSAVPTEAFRYEVTIPLAEAQYKQYFTVQACDSASGTYGAESLAFAYSPNPGIDIEAPVWNSSIGITKAEPRDQELRVYFGTAVDTESPPVLYRVYYAQGDPQEPGAAFDFESAEVALATSSPFSLTGLPNGEYWRAAVRAFDSAPVPNEESNTKVMGATIGATDIYPPVWQSGTGILDLAYGNGQALIFAGTAKDSSEDEFGVWESGPVVYRVYYGEGVTPNLGTAQFVDFADLGLEGCVLPISGIDTGKDHWFMVRARDSAAAANEDSNSNFIPGRAISAVDTSAPLGGPSVPASASANGPPMYAFSPGLQTHALVTQPTHNGQHWASVWDLGNDGYVSRADFNLASDESAAQYSLHAVALDASENLKALYVKESIFGDHVTVGEFRQSIGQSQDYRLDGNYEINLLAYNAHGVPCCFFDNYETGVASGETNFRFYCSGLPLAANNLLYDTTLAGAPQTVNFWDWGYARLADGRLGLAMRITDYNSGEEQYRLLLASTASSTTTSYDLTADRLVSVCGIGSAKPLVITESTLPGGKSQTVSDGINSADLDLVPDTVVLDVRIAAANMDRLLTVQKLRTDSFYGPSPVFEFSIAVLESPEATWKVPLLLSQGATSFLPLAALPGSEFVISYYAEQSQQDRHLVLRTQ